MATGLFTAFASALLLSLPTAALPWKSPQQTVRFAIRSAAGEKVSSALNFLNHGDRAAAVSSALQRRFTSSEVNSALSGLGLGQAGDISNTLFYTLESEVTDSNSGEVDTMVDMLGLMCGDGTMSELIEASFNCREHSSSESECAADEECNWNDGVYHSCEAKVSSTNKQALVDSAAIDGVLYEKLVTLCDGSETTNDECSLDTGTALYKARTATSIDPPQGWFFQLIANQLECEKLTSKVACEDAVISDAGDTCDGSSICHYDDYSEKCGLKPSQMMMAMFPLIAAVGKCEGEDAANGCGADLGCVPSSDEDATGLTSCELRPEVMMEDMICGSAETADSTGDCGCSKEQFEGLFEATMQMVPACSDDGEEAPQSMSEAMSFLWEPTFASCLMCWTDAASGTTGGDSDEFAAAMTCAPSGTDLLRSCDGEAMLAIMALGLAPGNDRSNIDIDSDCMMCLLIHGDDGMEECMEEVDDSLDMTCSAADQQAMQVIDSLSEAADAATGCDSTAPTTTMPTLSPGCLSCLMSSGDNAEAACGLPSPPACVQSCGSAPSSCSQMQAYATKGGCADGCRASDVQVYYDNLGCDFNLQSVLSGALPGPLPSAAMFLFAFTTMFVV